MIDSQFINQKLCQKNGFIDDPNSQESSEEFIVENKKYYQDIENYDWVKVADDFRGLEAILHRWREKSLLKLWQKYHRGEKLLDAGCGTGLMLRHFPKASIGLDINPRNLKKAKIHAPQAKLVLGDIEKIPFKNNSFSTIVCTEVLEHLPKPEVAIKEIFRVLEKGGLLIGSVPAKNLIWNLRFLSSTHPGEPYHRLYEEKEIKNLISSLGQIIFLEHGDMGMNFFFVVEKK
jgi:ubiquinone/menaquinone biosynthesis C-methylase UbiE